MTVKKLFTPPARAHGNASHHHTSAPTIFSNPYSHIHMARGCVVIIGNTWDHSHMLFTVFFSLSYSYGGSTMGGGGRRAESPTGGDG